MLGLGWGIGLFATSSVYKQKAIRDVFAALFVILTAFHGFFIFFMHCVRSTDVRKQWKRWLYRANGRYVDKKWMHYRQVFKEASSESNISTISTDNPVSSIKITITSEPSSDNNCDTLHYFVMERSKSHGHLSCQMEDIVLESFNVNLENQYEDIKKQPGRKSSQQQYVELQSQPDKEKHHYENLQNSQSKDNKKPSCVAQKSQYDDIDIYNLQLQEAETTFGNEFSLAYCGNNNNDNDNEDETHYQKVTEVKIDPFASKDDYV